MTNQISNFGMNNSMNNTIPNIFKNIIIIVILCFASSNSFAQIQISKDWSSSKKIKNISKTKSLDKLLTVKPLCPDLAVMPIQVQGTSSRSPRARGRRAGGNGLIISATIKNIGGENYVSGENQQSILLYINSRLVKKQDFINLAKGDQIGMKYTYTGTDRPIVKVYISYDPDIAMDGNEQNDECTYTNNQRTLNIANVQ